MAAQQAHWTLLERSDGEGRKNRVVAFQLVERSDQRLRVSGQFDRRRVRVQFAGARQGQTKQLSDDRSGAQQCRQRSPKCHAAMLRSQQRETGQLAIAGAPPSRYRFNNRWVCRLVRRALDRPPPKSSAGHHQAAPKHQSDSALACSSAPHPLDPQPPNPVKRSKTDIPTLLSADILALRLHAEIAIQMLRNVDVRSSLNGGHSPRQRLRQLCASNGHPGEWPGPRPLSIL